MTHLRRWPIVLRSFSRHTHFATGRFAPSFRFRVYLGETHIANNAESKGPCPLLGVLDHFLPPHYLPMSWYLPLKEDVSAEEAFAALEAGPRQTFKQVPWLSGKVYRQRPTTPKSPCSRPSSTSHPTASARCTGVPQPANGLPRSATNGTPARPGRLPNAYTNYASGMETVQQWYGHESWRIERLRALKAKYDPRNAFRFYNPIVGAQHH
ncbi:hypothetical protein GGS20DRAFT_529952 [Poronia punctata]|nr:hypothetical protein GGS20DRAFT_529952 [Poronia punctata]